MSLMIGDRWVHLCRFPLALHSENTHIDLLITLMMAGDICPGLELRGHSFSTFRRIDFISISLSGETVAMVLEVSDRTREGCFLPNATQPAVQWANSLASTNKALGQGNV